MLLLNECLSLVFISLSTQSGNFWIHPRVTNMAVLQITAMRSTLTPFTEVPEVLWSVRTSKNVQICYGYTFGSVK
jgi:hypothetical protein